MRCRSEEDGRGERTSFISTLEDDGRVGVTYKIRSLAIENKEVFHHAVVKAQYDPRILWYKNLGDQASRRKALESN